jgi:hypothetical protein
VTNPLRGYVCSFPAKSLVLLRKGLKFRGVSAVERQGAAGDPENARGSAVEGIQGIFGSAEGTIARTRLALLRLLPAGNYRRLPGARHRDAPSNPAQGGFRHFLKPQRRKMPNCQSKEGPVAHACRQVEPHSLRLRLAVRSAAPLLVTQRAARRGSALQCHGVVGQIVPVRGPRVLGL